MSKETPFTPSEVLVNIRPSSSLGSIVLGTELETRPDAVLYEDTSACCEDCPDANDNPPKESECPYFEPTAQGWPVCTRDGNKDQQIQEFFFKRSN